LAGSVRQKRLDEATTAENTACREIEMEIEAKVAAKQAAAKREGGSDTQIP
jgi:hypothetical protein